VVNTLFWFGTYHLVFVLYDHTAECSYNIISEDAAEFIIFLISLSMVYRSFFLLILYENMP